MPTATEMTATARIPTAMMATARVRMMVVMMVMPLLVMVARLAAKGVSCPLIMLAMPATGTAAITKKDHREDKPQDDSCNQ